MILLAAAFAVAVLASADAPPTMSPAEPAPQRQHFPPPDLETDGMSWDLGRARSTPGPLGKALPAPALPFRAAWSGFCARADGAAVLTPAGDYLGRIADRSHPESIFNPHGAYGGRFSENSVWNVAGRFGGTVARHSPFSRAGEPPLIVAAGSAIAALSADPERPGGVDPAVVALMCYGAEEFFEFIPEPRR